MYFIIFKEDFTVSSAILQNSKTFPGQKALFSNSRSFPGPRSNSKTFPGLCEPCKKDLMTNLNERMFVGPRIPTPDLQNARLDALPTPLAMLTLPSDDPNMTIHEFANTADPDEMTHNELIECLPLAFAFTR